MFSELNEDLIFSLIQEDTIQELSQTDEYNLLFRFSEDVFEKSQFFVPLKTGKLKKSGKMQAKGNTYTITYTTPYAVYVHEIIGNYHVSPTRSKFLESAFLSTYREYYLEFGKENLPKFEYFMSYSTEKVEMTIYMGVSENV